jgi:hypothetical protein
MEEKGMKLDIYGFDNTHNFSSYIGKLPMAKKSIGILPYKYYFMCENNYEPNYITEKLWEPILCETLCFYCGAPNVADYVDPRAFVQLDMNDFEKSYAIIVQAIEEDWWTQRIEYIRAAKKKLLEETSFFPFIQKIHESTKSTKST